MRLFPVFLSAFLLAGPIHPIVANAQHVQEPPCAPKAETLKVLKDKFNEIPVFIGNSKNGYQAIVTQSPKGTWTLLMIQAGPQGAEDDAIACFAASDGNPPDDSN